MIYTYVKDVDTWLIAIQSVYVVAKISQSFWDPYVFASLLEQFQMFEQNWREIFAGLYYVYSITNQIFIKATCTNRSVKYPHPWVSSIFNYFTAAHIRKWCYGLINTGIICSYHGLGELWNACVNIKLMIRNVCHVILHNVKLILIFTSILKPRPSVERDIYM